MKKLLPISVISLCLFLLGCNTQGTSNQDMQRPIDNAFVQVVGRQFQLQGKPYYFVGANMWYGAYLGSAGATGNQARLIEELDILKARGITNLRILASSESSELQRGVKPTILKDSKGALDQDLLKGLDFLLAEMAKREMKAVLYLNNFWQWSGGMSQYVAWFTGRPVVDPDVTGNWTEFMDNSALFYTIPEAQNLYQSVIKKIITRVNTVTGITYYNDPTIMSWQLANEPRPGSDSSAKKYANNFIQWIHVTAKYIKSLAPNQLVSTGNEGYMGSGQLLGLYEKSHASAYVDYLTFHMWIKNWGWFDVMNAEETYAPALVRAKKYLQQHVDVAVRMNKPIVLEEFGIERDNGEFEMKASVVYRDQFYSDIYAFIYNSAIKESVFSGSNFWAWGGAGRARKPSVSQSEDNYIWHEGDDFTGDPPQEPQGLNSVFDADHSTLFVIEKHAEKMHSIDR